MPTRDYNTLDFLYKWYGTLLRHLSKYEKKKSDHNFREITTSCCKDMKENIYSTAMGNILELNDINFHFDKVEWNEINVLIAI